MIIQNQIILCVYFADTTAKISKPSAHDEVWLVLLSTAMLCHKKKKKKIYIYIYIYIFLVLQYLQLFHVPYLMQGHCHGLPWPWLSEFRGVVLSCYTHSSTTVVITYKTEYSYFKVFPYSLSWVMKLVT